MRCCDCHEKQQRGELDHNRKNINGRAFTRASRTDSISGKTRTANEMRLGARGLPSNDSSAISPGAAPMPSLPAVSFFRRGRRDRQPLSGRPNPRAPATSAAFKRKKLTGLEGDCPFQSGFKSRLLGPASRGGGRSYFDRGVRHSGPGDRITVGFATVIASSSP